jgi:hypothetical protein
VVLNSIGERQRWRAQYEHAKTTAAALKALQKFRQLLNRRDGGGSTVSVVCASKESRHG